MFRLLCGALTAFVITNSQASAQEVGITPDATSHSITINGEVIQIERIQDSSHKLTSEFTKTSRPCPPFCIHPIAAAPGVATVGEIEVISFLENEVANGQGLLIDSRVPAWFAKGSIPGTVNVPFSALDETNPYRNEIVKALGAVQYGDS